MAAGRPESSRASRLHVSLSADASSASAPASHARPGGGPGHARSASSSCSSTAFCRSKQPLQPLSRSLSLLSLSTRGNKRRPLGTPTVAPSSSTPTLVPLPSPATSKARHKKFHRHFDSVPSDERVLNYYSCALISDILLQGHLYITNNYFAFYSNVFGYVTKVLIPTASVLKVSKEKTARIIPNAIGVATSEEKHVFGSLLSRDNTYKLMVQVWKTALGPPAAGPGGLSPKPLREVCAPRPRPKDLKDEVDSASASGDVLQEDDDSSLSGDAALPPVPLDKIPVVAATKASVVAAAASAGPSSALAIAGSSHPGGAGSGAGPGSPSSLMSQADFTRSSRQTVILGVSTALVAFLLMSTAFLFHRMSRIQDQFRIQTGDNLYQDLARWQNHLHARSAGQVEEFLSTHLDQLAKVRKSLEALTLLIVSNDDDQTQHADIAVHHHSPYRDEKHQTRPPSLAQEEVKNS
ncbi:Protein Aster-B [Frankliniella fusca]|uniref:Protein Aster-B n=1 Tax=Frankliniella fusca TaxID=407009 RepID=A0AAE1I130_9NEOP|nr:Protein Aster-B [Frankliniella fusca]